MKVTRRHCFFALAGLLGGLCVATSVVRGADGDIAPDVAFAKSKAGEVLLIDVRTPQEWRQSGLPQGAQPVTLDDPAGLEGFVAAVRAVVGGDEDRPVALICASGRRSLRAKAALEAAGFTEVYNVVGGMFGKDGNVGWTQQSLPTEACTHC